MDDPSAQSPHELQNRLAARLTSRGEADRELLANLAGDIRPTRLVLDMANQAWALFLLKVLEDGPLRYNEVHRALPGISHRMLSRTLRSLERNGMLIRTVYPEIPPRSEYTLTSMAESFIPSLDSLIAWAYDNYAEMMAARERFDENDV